MGKRMLQSSKVRHGDLVIMGCISLRILAMPDPNTGKSKSSTTTSTTVVVPLLVKAVKTSRKVTR